MLRRYLYILGWLLTVSLPLCSRESLQFRHLGVADGLSNNQIHCIFKDSEGFMWFGTHSGLNRYDGYRMKHYYSEPGEHSMLQDAIYQIQEDARGYLWMKLREERYILYDRQTDSFIRDYRDQLQQLGIVLSGEVRFIHLDTRKDLWVYDGASFYYYRFDEGTLRMFRQEGSDSGITPGEITAVTNQGDYYYLLHRSGLLEILQISTGEVIYRNNDLQERAAFSGESLSLFVDTREDIWIYSTSAQGLWRWSSADRKWYHFSRQSPVYTLSHDLIRGLAEDLHGNVWIATDHGGIHIYLRDPEKTIHVGHHPDIPTSVCSNSIVSIYRDDEGIIWLGSFKKGISYYSEIFQKFPVYYLTDANDRAYKFDINTISEDQSGALWLGTDGNGVLQVDPSTQNVRRYRKGSSASALSGDVIVTLLHDSSDRLWIGTFLDGITLREKDRFTHFDQAGGTLTDNNIWALQEDPQGNIWAGTLHRGLHVYDAQKKGSNPSTGT